MPMQGDRYVIRLAHSQRLRPEYIQQRAIEALRHLHAMQAGTPEFGLGGQEAREVLAPATAYLEQRQFNDGEYGGAANVAP
jgi:hypothetical protein